MAGAKEDLRYCYCNSKQTSVTTGTGLLNNKRVYLFYQIATNKLCHLVPIFGAAKSNGITIRVAKNANKRRIRYMLLEVQ